VSSTVAGRYDEWHADHDDGPSRPEAVWHVLAERHLGDLSGLRVLEIGCGRGEFTRLLAERGAVVTGMDVSEYAVSRAAALVAEFPDADTRTGDICDIDFPDGTFDLVVSLETIEHSPSVPKAVSELVRVTRPGGRLIITSPNYVSLVGLYRAVTRLFGRHFTEGGQPVNNWTTTVGRVVRLRRRGCHVEAVEGRVVLLPVPRYHAIQLRWLEHPRWLMRWFCLHGLTAATKTSTSRRG